MEITKEISNPVINIIAKALMISEEEVKLESKLTLELDAESIDILDIRFGIEQFFGIKFSNNDIWENIENLATNKKLTKCEIENLFTVESICKYVATKIGGKNV